VILSECYHHTVVHIRHMQ